MLSLHNSRSRYTRSKLKIQTYPPSSINENKIQLQTRNTPNSTTQASWRSRSLPFRPIITQADDDAYASRPATGGVADQTFLHFPCMLYASLPQQCNQPQNTPPKPYLGASPHRSPYTKSSLSASERDIYIQAAPSTHYRQPRCPECSVATGFLLSLKSPFRSSEVS